MADLLVAVGLVLALEGLLYAAFPGGMKQAIRAALDLPDATLRTVGLVAAVAGVTIVWLVRG